MKTYVYLETKDAANHVMEWSGEDARNGNAASPEEAVQEHLNALAYERGQVLREQRDCRTRLETLERRLVELQDHEDTVKAASRGVIHTEAETP